VIHRPFASLLLIKSFSLLIIKKKKKQWMFVNERDMAENIHVDQSMANHVINKYTVVAKKRE
jgi:hypothetical protein